MAWLSTIEITFFLVFVVFLQKCTSSVIVESPFGKLQGMEMTANNSKNYIGFRNIPYAKPPVGKLRLAKPQPHPPLDGIFDASKDIKMCPQPIDLLFGEEQQPGQEDCLILNIYTKDVSPTASHKKKVLVFIHGGGFIFGSSKEYEAGTFVTEQDVIVVTINYRLGVLGFLSTENEAGLGNYGLWDQALAIKWVKDNIDAFGGDANDIAIGGESAGGASTAYQAITPVMKGVFTKAYPMSGTSTSAFGLSLDARADAVKFAKGCNCWSGSEDAKIDLAESQQIMDCLKERPLEDFTSFTYFGKDHSTFRPSVDGDFLPGNPHVLLKNDNYLESVGFFNRKYLIGVDNNEKSVMSVANKMAEHHIMGMENLTEEEKTKMIGQQEYATVSLYLHTRLGTSISDRVKDQVVDWYNRRFHTEAVTEMVTDLFFLIPSYDFLNAIARSKSTDAYFFYFNYYPSFMKGEYKGIPHGVDIPFWFDIDVNSMERILRVGVSGRMDRQDLELKERFSSLIANFVKKGNPSDAIKDKVPSGWPTYDLQGSHYLDFNSEPSVRQHLERDRRDFWLEKIPKISVAEETREKHQPHSEL